MVASLTEDAAVLGVVWFSLEHPRTAAAVAGVLLLLGLVMLVVLARLVRRGLAPLAAAGGPVRSARSRRDTTP